MKHLYLPLCVLGLGGLLAAAPGARAAALPAAAATTAAATAAADDDYPVNFALDETTGNTGRYLTSISLSSPADGEQTIAVPHDAPMLLYRPLLGEVFTARAGETVTPTFGFSGTWMNGYVYLDRGSDGAFSYALNADYTIADGQDLMTYSYVMATDGNGGYASDGSPLTGNATNVLNPPAFTIPADLAPGYYRMRYKVDWGCVDPGGNTDASQLIKNNGGEIVDVRLNIHGDNASVTALEAEGGSVTAADGTALSAAQVPFGQALTLRFATDAGYMLDGFVVRHGYGLDGDSLVHGTPQYADVTLPGYLVQDGCYTLPASLVDGDVRITPHFVALPASSTAEGDYPLSFDAGEQSAQTPASDAYLRLRTSATQGGSSLVSISAISADIYQDMTRRQVSAVPGDVLTFTVQQSVADGLFAHLYVDLNQDGQFTPLLDAEGRPTMSGELVAYACIDGRNSAGQAVDAASANGLALPTYTLPESLPLGVYRGRLVLDQPGTDPAASAQIAANGGRVVDFLLNVHALKQPLEVITTNGSVHGNGTNGLPPEVKCFSQLIVVPTPAADGYEAPDGMTIRHGHNLDGPQYIHGNRQWSQYTRSATRLTIPRDSVNGDLRITVHYEPTAAAEYQLVFSDEFDAADGTQPSADVWMRCPRQSSTWNRWLSDSELVVYQEGGQLVTRAIPNPDTATDNVPMITGGVQTQGHYDFLYGKIEARIFTNPHTGNFPAFWLMPADQSDGWPTCGEIDIWEQVDNGNTAYHTVHSHWTYDLGNTGSPRSSFNETVPMDAYHTYGLEWTEDQLTWYVDGTQVGTYAKSTSTSALEQGQWPFDKAFYIILNQSVGNGSWAAAADVSHTYETRFDWVRVYQKATPDAIAAAPTTSSAVSVSATAGTLVLSAAVPTEAVVYDLSGRTLWRGIVSGQQRISVSRGLYIVAGRKVMVP